MAHANSVRVVIAALAGNLLIAISKAVAAFITGSTAALAEAVHSFADSGNQVLLLLGLRLAEREPTDQHPFGRTIERYFWPFIVSIMLFTVGGAFAIYEGVHKLFELRHHADVVEKSNLANYIVLGLAFAFESYSFAVAFSEFKKLRLPGQSFMKTIRAAKDPTVPVVILEDTAALIGLFIALVGISLSDITGWAGFDGIGSLLIGALLCVVAVVLGRETHSLLIGESATPQDREQVRRIVMGMGGVRGLRQLISLHRGPQDVLLALKVDFERSLTVEQIEKLVNDIEAAIRAELPQMRFIFIEPDSTYVQHQDPVRAQHA